MKISSLLITLNLNFLGPDFNILFWSKNVTKFNPPSHMCVFFSSRELVWNYNFLSLTNFTQLVELDPTYPAWPGMAGHLLENSTVMTPRLSSWHIRRRRRKKQQGFFSEILLWIQIITETNQRHCRHEEVSGNCMISQKRQ